jgi:hypothetical protein
MSETLTCPDCQRKMRLPDNVMGKKVKCPSCNAVFLATPPEPPAGIPVPVPVHDPEPAEPVAAPSRKWTVSADDDEPPPVPPRPDPTGEVALWENVRTGVWFQAAGHVCYLVGLFFLFILVVLLSTMGEARPTPPPSFPGAPVKSEGVSPRVILALAVLSLLTLSGAWTAALAGSCFGLSAPPRLGLRGAGVAGVALTGVILLLALTGQGIVGGGGGGSDRGDDQREAAVVRYTLQFLMLLPVDVARLALLAVFLRGVAVGTGHRRAARSAGALTIVTPAAILGSVMLSLLMLMLVEPGPTVGVILFVFVFVAYVVVLVMGLGLMLQTNQNIGKAIRNLTEA